MRKSPETSVLFGSTRRGNAAVADALDPPHRDDAAVTNALDPPHCGDAAVANAPDPPHRDLDLATGAFARAWSSDWPVAHGGDPAAIDAPIGTVADASASINPLGPPLWLRQEIERSISALVHYPDPNCAELRRIIAANHATSPQSVIVGNGSSELLAWLPHVAGAATWIVPTPSYGEYQRSPILANRKLVAFPLGGPPDFSLDWGELGRVVDRHAQKPNAVILGHPNNPTGRCLDVSEFARLRRQHPTTLFVVDEAFGDFCEGFSSVWDASATNLLVLRSLTKSLAIPGLRLGYALGCPTLCSQLQRRLPPWSVNLLAQRVGIRAMENLPFLAEMRSALIPLKRDLFERLSALSNGRVFDTDANWLLLELTAWNARSREVVEACRVHGVSLRCCDDFRGLEERWLRISVRSSEQNERIATTLGKVLGNRSQVVSAKRRPRAIMLQGCSSDAGKSLLVTALCRCLAQDGYRVAPFKAQNMSNNSGIASDGGEIGRAQIVQAWAARLTPDTRMNPVLLKPTSDRGAQIVLRGRALGHRDVSGYVAVKDRCLQSALAAYDSLVGEFDVIVCEGAGSAGEMNLRRRDIVNMGFVERRDMPVLLVGDIDRGGVYASFVGHLAVMSEADRRRVSGFVVNRFRGDPSLLAEAHAWVERHTGRPILGVMPFLPNLLLPDEDRLSLEVGRRSFGRSNAALQIAAVVPLHVSNATDLDPLKLEDDVHLYLVERPEELGQPDAIILLGTKNTCGDLRHLQQLGLAAAILAAHAKGVTVIGICGGLQMLGQSIIDSAGVEALETKVPGLGLLPLQTSFLESKRVLECRVRHLPSGTEVRGYEIHHGATDFANVEPLFVDDAGQVLGGGLPDANVWGTYIHGLFESDDFRSVFLDGLRARKGLGPSFGRQHRRLDATFDDLASAFRTHVDYRRILRMLGVT